MNKLQKWVAFLLCACMLLSVAALAEDAAPVADESAIEGAAELADADVVATVNGEAITWADVKGTYDGYVSQYGSSYDMTESANQDLFHAVALYSVINDKVLTAKAKELGVDQLTDAEINTANASADTDWESAIENYISYYHSDLTDESTEEAKTAARDEAVKYYNDLGYTPESLHEDYQHYAVLDKVQAIATQDAVVTDEDVEAAYQELVANDKELYQNNISAYIEYNNYVDQMAYYSMMYGQASEMDYAWYKPAGFRAVKHILLPVDETLMTAYTDLLARYEEQQDMEEAAAEATVNATADATAEPAADAEPTAEPTATPEPVTEQQVNDAKAAILASLADKIDEINQKIADGVDFDELIATYAVDADGNATDNGMVNEPGKTSGYEVASASTNYVPEFVEAAFSVENIGDVSAPYISSYGVHIVKYIADVAEGPVAMTDAQRTAKRESMLTTKQNELYNAAVESWTAAAQIEYTGLIPSMAEVEAEQAAAAAAQTVTDEETAATDAPADDTTATDAPADDTAEPTATPEA